MHQLVEGREAPSLSLPSLLLEPDWRNQHPAASSLLLRLRNIAFEIPVLQTSRISSPPSASFNNLTPASSLNRFRIALSPSICLNLTYLLVAFPGGRSPAGHARHGHRCECETCREPDGPVYPPESLSSSDARRRIDRLLGRFSQERVVGVNTGKPREIMVVGPQRFNAMLNGQCRNMRVMDDVSPRIPSPDRLNQVPEV